YIEHVGVVNMQAAELAEKTGLKVIMDRCMMIEHKRFKREHLPDERRLT
ncbi:MAG: CoA-binding protein, partial [Candidatus Brockarchaeota archaeon]|nr:CoA-binding protein [Candidatus Brockarchaeota archaeon]